MGEHIKPKSTNGPAKRLEIKGLSVINGAQTIASTAKFAEDYPSANINDARVMITVINASGEGSARLSPALAITRILCFSLILSHWKMSRND